MAALQSRLSERGGQSAGQGGNYRTAYLWEETLTRDSLLDILARYMHLQVEERQIRTASGVRTIRKETMIFPRYHQLDCRAEAGRPCGDAWAPGTTT